MPNNIMGGPGGQGDIDSRIIYGASPWYMKLLRGFSRGPMSMFSMLLGNPWQAPGQINWKQLPRYPGDPKGKLPWGWKDF